MSPKHPSEREVRSRPDERNWMRKSLATLAPLLAVMALVVAACGGGDNSGNKGGSAPNTGQKGKVQAQTPDHTLCITDPLLRKVHYLYRPAA